VDYYERVVLSFVHISSVTCRQFGKVQQSVATPLFDDPAVPVRGAGKTRGNPGPEQESESKMTHQFCQF
jgi:hypothetical protein